MSELIWQGLNLSILGLGLTFTGLGVLVLLIMLLRQLFRSNPDDPAPTLASEKSQFSMLARDTQDEEVVAAIATALTYLQSLEVAQGRLGTLLEKGPGPWWTRGVAQKHSPHIRHSRGVR